MILKEMIEKLEGIESMLVGALVGGGVSGTRSMITRDSEGRGEYGQRKAAAKYATDVLNGAGSFSSASGWTLSVDDSNDLEFPLTLAQDSDDNLVVHKVKTLISHSEDNPLAVPMDHTINNNFGCFIIRPI